MKIKKEPIHISFEDFVKSIKISRKVYKSGKVIYEGIFVDPLGQRFIHEETLKLHEADDLDEYDIFIHDVMIQKLMKQVNKGI